MLEIISSKNSNDKESRYGEFINLVTLLLSIAFRDDRIFDTFLGAIPPVYCEVFYLDG